MQPWNLARTNYAVVKQQSYEVAVLPLGATEPHNLHLPYGTDLFEGNLVGEKVCEAAWNNGGKVILLPTIPYGTENNMHQFPLAMNVDPQTLFQVIRDLIDSLLNSGIRKIVLLNSHGGNELRPLMRELNGKSDAHLFLCNWFSCFGDVYHDIFDQAEDHAGEMETSFGLAYFPDLVARDPSDPNKLAADEGATRKTQFEALNQGWVSMSRPWHLLTSNSGSGNPHAATAEKGQQMMDVLVERIGGFLVELSQAAINEHFPYNV